MIEYSNPAFVVPSGSPRRNDPSIAERNDSMKHYLGIDIGGTKIAVGLFDQDKNLILEERMATFPSPEPDVFYAHLARELRAFLARRQCAGIDGIGVGVPGTVKDGVVSSTPNIQALCGFPLRQRLEADFGCRAVIDNDANATGLAQFRAHDIPSGNMIYLTVSTGIGCAIIINGRLFRGDDGFAGEVGQMVTGRRTVSHCRCGNDGCYEALASGVHISDRVAAAVRGGAGGPLADRLAGTGSVNGIDIKTAADAQDSLALRIIHETGELVGELCYNLYAALNIGAYCIGGGLTAWGEPLLNSIRSKFSELSGREIRLFCGSESAAGTRGALHLLFEAE